MFSGQISTKLNPPNILTVKQKVPHLSHELTIKKIKHQNHRPCQAYRINPGVGKPKREKERRERERFSERERKREMFENDSSLFDTEEDGKLQGSKSFYCHQIQEWRS